MKYKPMIRLNVLFLSMLLLMSAPEVQAAKAGEGWDSALNSIDTLYDGLTAVQAGVKLQSAEVTALRKSNNERLSALKARIKAIDQPLITRLTQESEGLQRKHASLLDQYNALGKQATAARKRKDKKAVDLFELRRNKLKPSATAASSEIKAKKAALAAAKKAAAAKAKMVKDALVPVQNLKKQITAENKVIAAARKRLAAADKRYKAAVKSGDAVSAIVELKTVYDQTRQVHTSLKTVHDWESKIAKSLTAATAKLP
ncbi:hypothetical protein [Paenibacillus senegalimassiliensis]|uniref:hypothetical protein n=1 Tax=Paenibacillus senegalimassiliensis TaxID=1737426 RepID=UPI00073FA2A7|nr:hypothetical protein [Paenibacillus senegalimassiliensis]